MFGVSSMTTTLRRVAVRRPDQTLLTADARLWHYGSSFEPSRVMDEHTTFTNLLSHAGVDVVFMDNDDRGIADAVFTYDASLVTPNGAVLMAPGKALRAGEQEIHRAFYQSQSIPLVGEISGEATAEAGDTLWIDESTLVIGRGFRTNQQGFQQLTEIMQSIGVETHQFDLPVYHGKTACLHLMSLISLVDTHKALVCLPLLPVSFFELLRDRGYELIEANFDEFVRSGTLSTNVLAIAPGQCVMIDGYNKTKQTLEVSGIEVETFSGDALCIGCEGGPTCLTRPLLRAATSAPYATIDTT